VANAVAADIDYNMLKKNVNSNLTQTNPALRKLVDDGFRPSRLFLYYNARFLRYADNEDRSQNEPFTTDSGTLASYMLQSAQTQGIATEGSSKPNFPYPGNDDASHVSKNPGAANYLAARTVKVTSFNEFTSAQITPAFIKAQLAGGQPVLIGMNLPDYKRGANVFSATDRDKLIKNGRGGLPTIPAPGKTYQPGGGHEMLLVGYNNQKKAAIVLNSWGSDWGKNGYAYLPNVYLNYRWIDDAETISGITISTTPAPSIGESTQLTDRQGVVDGKKSKGEVNIDTQPGSSSASGTATSFNFYSHTNGSHYVTPLLFNFNPSSQTYTLTGIGASFKPEASGAGKKGEQVGIPFVASFGSANVTSTSRFGFYDGDVTSAGKNERVKANAGIIPYSAQRSGSPAWLSSTGPVEPGALKVGMTFSGVTAANVALTRTASRTYSAMLNE
jgi:Papain family cysteine protease